MKKPTVCHFAAVPEKKLPRKKFTSGHARARRLAVQAGKRLRSLKEGLIHSDSEESYGEVDEKTVEEGWEVEDSLPKTEVCIFCFSFVKFAPPQRVDCLTKWDIL